MEDWLKCQISPLVKYHQNQKKTPLLSINTHFWFSILTLLIVFKVNMDYLMPMNGDFEILTFLNLSFLPTNSITTSMYFLQK